MSDYNPGPGGPYDKYGNTNYEPVDPGGRGPYILLGILVAIGLIGGLLYFNGTPRSNRTNEAQAPAQHQMQRIMGISGRIFIRSFASSTPVALGIAYSVMTH